MPKKLDRRDHLTTGRTRRALSVGSLTTQVGGSYLMAALKRPFQSVDTQRKELLDTHLRNALRIVERSRELKGTFLKLLQMLSMRNDLLPAEVLQILSVVQSEVPPMSAAVIRKQIQRELGKSPEQLFASFDDEAFAAASLGQVHRARLHSGEDVVIKVMALIGVAFTLFLGGLEIDFEQLRGPLLPASVYLVGGVFFSTGGYASVLQVINAPRERPGGGFEPEPWRWWAFERTRLDWLSAAALFLGTLVFGFLLISSFIAELSPPGALSAAAQNRLIWSPDMVGCALFLVSGHFAMVELTGTWLPRRWPREIGWKIVVLNQLGSVLFMVSAVASFYHPDGDVTSAAVANWGTFGGALCFAIAGVMQEFERPGTT